jgi:O-antigen ligase
MSLFFERLSYWLFVVTIAWAPFPLGSNRPWSWSLLILLITACWLLWCVSTSPKALLELSKGLRGPILLCLLALGWGVIQVLPLLPLNVAQPIWHSAAALTGRAVTPALSFSPWLSIAELAKLSSYVMAAWLARVFAQDTRRAYNLLNALTAIGAFYAAYSLVLVVAGYSQFELFYGIHLQQAPHNFPGPFVNRNSFATYEGLIAVCAGSRLVSEGWKRGPFPKGFVDRLAAIGKYLFERGLLWLMAAVLALATVVSTGSRGGNLATWSALLALVFIAMGIATRQKRSWSAFAVAPALLASVLALMAMSGSSLAGRLNDMASTGSTDTTRMLLWANAARMIAAEPFTGWGLGTYQIVYPVFSKTTLPLVMDKAHNDYLELAAGWGIPAAMLWWGALVWLVWICLRGVIERRRNRLLPALAVGTSILVGIHSLFDFSLQMPAVALTYAAILGLGLAQSFRRHPSEAAPND